MGADDGDCLTADGVGHEWQLMGVALVPGHGAPTEYACTKCGAVLYRSPDDPFPGTV